MMELNHTIVHGACRMLKELHHSNAKGAYWKCTVLRWMVGVQYTKMCCTYWNCTIVRYMVYISWWKYKIQNTKYKGAMRIVEMH